MGILQGLQTSCFSQRKSHWKRLLHGFLLLSSTILQFLEEIGICQLELGKRPQSCKIQDSLGKSEGFGALGVIWNSG